jgi:hypothetical protein
VPADRLTVTVCQSQMRDPAPRRYRARLVRRLIILLVVIGALAAPAAVTASADTCRPVHDLPELDGSRYEGTDIIRIRTVGVGCRHARRVAHRATVKGFRLGARVLSYRWRRWRVERDLRGDVDRYAAAAGAARVSWRVGSVA